MGQFQVQTHQMWVAFTWGWWIGKKWTEKETTSRTMTGHEVNHHESVKELGVSLVSITTIPEAVQNQPQELKLQL
eukprot:4466779-Amphidinium_carterae.2